MQTIEKRGRAGNEGSPAVRTLSRQLPGAGGWGYIGKSGRMVIAPRRLFSSRHSEVFQPGECRQIEKSATWYKWVGVDIAWGPS